MLQKQGKISHTQQSLNSIKNCRSLLSKSTYGSPLKSTQAKISISNRISFMKGAASRRYGSQISMQNHYRPPRVEDVQKIKCLNIVESCNFLEHQQKFKNMPLFKEMDKEKVLHEYKQDKMFEMIN